MSLRTAYSAFIHCPLSIWCHFCGISIKGPLGSYLCTSGDELAIPTGGLFQLWLVLTVRTVLVFWNWVRVPLPFTSKPSFTGWGDFKPVFFFAGWRDPANLLSSQNSSSLPWITTALRALLPRANITLHWNRTFSSLEQGHGFFSVFLEPSLVLDGYNLQNKRMSDTTNVFGTDYPQNTVSSFLLWLLL